MDGRSIPLVGHDDTTIDHVEEAHAREICISEFPTTLEAAWAARERGMSTVMGAPNAVLGRRNPATVSLREVAAAGLLDGVFSDCAAISMLQAAVLVAEGDENSFPGGGDGHGEPG